jgi:hypothetical protein
MHGGIHTLRCWATEGTWNEGALETPRAVAVLIDEAFHDVLYPGDDGLVVIQKEHDPERLEIREGFAGKHWSVLPLSFLRYHHQSLFFFTSAAYRFYLPAYLKASTISYNKAGNIPGSVVFSLTRPQESGPDLDRFLVTMEGFSAAQGKTILAFLHLLLADHSGDFPGNELDSAIDGFWFQFK